MQFNSLDYMLFLLVVLAGYWLCLRLQAARLVFIVVTSCLFYMSWHPTYIFLVLGSIALDFTAGIRIGDAKTGLAKRAWLAVSVTGNLGLLGTFKYFDFFSQAVTDLARLLDAEMIAPQLNLLLPAGISFYTFQTLGYSIDCYRGTIPPTRNLLKFATFVTFFPTLVAGPIVRAATFLPQLEDRPRLAGGAVSEGLFLIATGLVKKIVIADFLSTNLVDRVFDNPELYSATEVVLGLYGFTMQIYCDFSGYTDVARGSAKLFGIELPQNFDRPYQATSPAEFWRRWHMTLSTWLRDYLYYPLGGSKGSPARTYVNLWITIFLIGLWHGASWNFVIYGMLQATAMILHRWFYRRSRRTRGTIDSLPLQAIKIAACLQFVVFSRVLFRATDLANTKAVLARLMSDTYSVAQLTPSVWIVLVGAFAAHYVPRAWFAQLQEGFAKLPAPAQAAALLGLGIGLNHVASAAVVPYIYFQF